MKTIRQIWDETPYGEAIKNDEYIHLVNYICENFDKILPNDRSFVGEYWGKLGCWDKTINEARAIVDKRIKDNEELAKK